MEYYDTLGVDKGASQDDIKKAYRKLAMKHHPDKGGDSEKFKQITEAFETLSDPQKRRRYDQFGKAGVDAGGQGGHGPFGGSPFDIFETFFGRQERQGTQHKQRDTMVDFAVSLEDAFVGKNVKMNVTHKKKCGPCDGNGNTKEPVTCDMCRGMGEVHHRIQMGPMQQIIRQPCDACQGKGRTFNPRYACSSCASKGYSLVTEKVDFRVDPGTREDTIKTIKGMGDFNGVQSDLIIRLKYKSHPSMTVKGLDIHVTQKLHMYEALCGSQFVFTHLNNTRYLMHTKRVIESGSVHTVRGMGMSKEGHLFIRFEVVYPSKLLTPNSTLADMLSYTAPSHGACEHEHIIM